MSKVSIVECPDYDETKVLEAVRKSLDDIGYKIRPNSKVLIKPNILSQHPPKHAITTHPAVMGAICRILKENNCQITIGESSGFYQEGGTLKAMKLSGIADVAKRYGAKLITFEESGSKAIKDEGSVILKELNIANPIFEADIIINVPKLKTHTLMQFTGAVKNLLGTLPGGLKQQCHVKAPKADDFGNLLLDIHRHVPISLNIMDAIVGLEGNGPGAAGKPKQTGLILASENPFSMDVVAQRIIGMDPLKIPTTRNAIRRNMFNIESIEVIGKETQVRYKKPIHASGFFVEFISNLVISYAIITPKVADDRCKKCQKCVKVCPVGAMEMHQYPKVNKKRCIHCYCCHEMCPYDAIDLKPPLLLEIARKVRNTLNPL